MILPAKNNTAAFVISSLVCLMACTYAAYAIILFIIKVPFHGIAGYFVYAFWCALLLWQLSHIGLCIYFYATDSELPHFARIYLYVDMAIMGAVMLGVLALLVSTTISNCKDIMRERCVLIGLDNLGILALSWLVLGSNIMMAYSVIKLNTVELYKALPYKSI